MIYCLVSSYLSLRSFEDICVFLFEIQEMIELRKAVSWEVH